MRCLVSETEQNMGERSATSEPHTLYYTPRRAQRGHSVSRDVIKSQFILILNNFAITISNLLLVLETQVLFLHQTFQ